jgi:hypothetical protein
MQAPFRLRVGGYCGGEYDKTFESFEEAVAECDRLNSRDEWVACLYDAAGVCVRDHSGVWEKSHAKKAAEEGGAQ